MAMKRWLAGIVAAVWVAAAPVRAAITRGLDIFSGLAFVGFSRIRKTAVFGDLPLDDRRESLQCGVAVVECGSGTVLATPFFKSGVEEMFDVCALPGYGNTVIAGPYPDVDETTIWLLPYPEPAAAQPGVELRRPASGRVCVPS